MELAWCSKRIRLLSRKGRAIAGLAESHDILAVYVLEACSKTLPVEEDADRIGGKSVGPRMVFMIFTTWAVDTSRDFSGGYR